MPRVLVVFDSEDERAERLAQSAAEGARRVRFTEVDVRVVGDESSAGDATRRRLEPTSDVDQYDGVIVVGSDRGISAPIDALLSRVEQSAKGDFVDRVFAVVGGGSSTAQRLSAVGGIVVSVRGGVFDVETAARQIGERVAKVAGWVRHALSHQGRVDGAGAALDAH